MANEFYVRKGLAIATSSIATASGATQATKYLVVGDDSVIRWATASVTSGVSGTSGIDGTSGTSGSSGTSGTSGVSGTSGTSGSSGVQGESAGIPYNYITSGTLSDPGSGNLKFISSGFLSSVSQILVNHNDLNTNDNELFLESLSGGVLTLKSNLNSGTNFAVFTITSVTNFSTYVSFSVNISFTTGNWSFVSTDLVVLNFSKSGTSGTSGVNGTSGTSGVSFVGSGTNDYLARWTPDGSTLGNSLIQDDGTNIGVNYAPQSGVQLAVGNSVNPTSVYVLNSYATSSTTKGLQVLSIGTPTDGPRIGVDIYVSPSPSNYGLKINDGREGLGKVLTSDATGNAYWSNNIGTTGSTITLTGNLVLNTATASSGVFSHYFQVTVNGTLLKIPLYY